MICPKCKKDWGKEFTTTCPDTLGGCGKKLNFIEWLIYSKPFEGLLLLSVIIGLIFMAVTTI